MVVKSETVAALQVIVDDRLPIEIGLHSPILEFGVQVPVVQGLAGEKHQVQIRALDEGVGLDSFIVR